MEPCEKFLTPKGVATPRWRPAVLELSRKDAEDSLELATGILKMFLSGNFKRCGKALSPENGMCKHLSSYLGQPPFSHRSTFSPSPF